MGSVGANLVFARSALFRRRLGEHKVRPYHYAAVWSQEFLGSLVTGEVLAPVPLQGPGIFSPQKEL